MDRISLKEISWKVDEQTYREDKSLSYSILSKFNREGFEKLGTLYDRVDSPSLLFGSIVDCLITESKERALEKYYPVDIPTLNATNELIANNLYKKFHDKYSTMLEIPKEEICYELNENQYQMGYSLDRRIKNIITACNSYYSLLFIAGNKRLVSSDVFNNAEECYHILKSNKATSAYFMEDNPMDNSVERFYQLKFKGEFAGISLKCMVDELIVDYKNKKIIPIDLKTSGSPEYDFPKSFLKWGYWIQAQLYTYLIKQNLEKSEYFKDFELENYRFIVINRSNKIPLVWVYTDSDAKTNCFYGLNSDIVCRNFREIAAELNKYLTNNEAVPWNIKQFEQNDIVKMLKTF